MLKTDEDIIFTEKPWGYEREWIRTDNYVSTYVYIRAGEKRARQYHEKKEKTIYVLTGPIILELGPDDDNDDILTIGVMDGEAYHIRPEAVYRISAPEDFYVELMEVSTPHRGDIVRLEDQYSRIPDISA
jgi:mannose-6-phosphate isomerase-like protein (cupin superfamily)